MVALRPRATARLRMACSTGIIRSMLFKLEGRAGFASQPFREPSDVDRLDDLGERAVADERRDEPWKVACRQRLQADAGAQGRKRNQNSDRDDDSGQNKNRRRRRTLDEWNFLGA